jgi:hypothetical protein
MAAIVQTLPTVELTGATLVLTRALVMTKVDDPNDLIGQLWPRGAGNG